MPPQTTPCLAPGRDPLDDEELLARPYVPDPPRLSLRRLDARRAGELELEVRLPDPQRVERGLLRREVVPGAEGRRQRPLVQVRRQDDEGDEPDEPETPSRARSTRAPLRARRPR